MFPRKLEISLDNLFAQHPDAPTDVQVFDYKGNVIAVSFDTGIVYRVDKKYRNSTKWNRITEGTFKCSNTSYSKIGINYRHERLHRVIESCRIGRYLGANDLIDHKIQNGTINSADNLRLLDANVNANNSANNRNRKHQGKYQSYGVSWNKQDKKFQAYANFDRTKYHLGCFTTEKAAAFVSDVATYYLHREHARLNLPLVAAMYAHVCSHFQTFDDLKLWLRTLPAQLDTIRPEVSFTREQIAWVQSFNK